MEASKFWISKHALTEGIFEVEAIIKEKSPDYIHEVNKPSGFNRKFHGEGKEWHRTKEEAILKAEAMKQSRLNGLKKQVTNLENLRFE